MLIIFEGPNGAGKTTLVSRFEGAPATETFHQPSDGPHGAAVRSGEGTLWDSFLDRAQVYRDMAESDADLQLCDRCWPSAIIYQGAPWRPPQTHRAWRLIPDLYFVCLPREPLGGYDPTPFNEIQVDDGVMVSLEGLSPEEVWELECTAYRNLMPEGDDLPVVHLNTEKDGTAYGTVLGHIIRLRAEAAGEALPPR